MIECLYYVYLCMYLLLFKGHILVVVNKLRIVNIFLSLTYSLSLSFLLPMN